MIKNKKHNKNILPALGEKRAISGYNFQYKSTAHLILKYLKKKQLKWIKLIDPQAGKVDDLQINISGTIYAYQMKWRSKGYLSFKEITSSSNNKPSIINQLADGWRKLKRQEVNVKVCFLTNMSPSKDDKLFQNNSGQTKSFKNFIEEQWSDKDSLIQNSFPKDWKEIWGKIVSESKLSNIDFLEFIKDCEFIFSFEHSKEVNSLFPEDSQTLNKDIDKLSNFVSNSISQTKKLPLKLTSEDLLKKIGWSDRIEYKNTHDFPVDRKIYEPIEDSKKKLLKTIKEIKSGYILLQGSPGSGKSTLLSASLSNSNETKIIKYFSYVPDDKSLSISRGESINFLHDISQKLESCGYKGGDSLNTFEQSFLLKRLKFQFQEIKDEYTKSKLKVIIVVDGLDHIERELSPNRSLLSDLPLPDSLPEGVVFLLSSQLDKLKNLPPKIEQQINKSGRKLIIDKLNKEAVLKIINKSKLKVDLDANQKNIVFEKSEGHPLALKLILKQVSRCKNMNLDSQLQTIDKFNNSIEEAYYSHWKKIKENTKLVRLLGLVSRMTEGIDWNWIFQWEEQDQDTIDVFKKDLWYYFEEEGEKWYFFHNSFRVFIEHKTIEKPHGGIDKNEDKKFHKLLAKYIGVTTYKFGEIFHLYKAEAYQDIINISTQKYFKEQIDQFCHPSTVLDDIKFSILAAKKENNLNHIFNLMLSGSTVNLINSYLLEDPIKLINLFLSLEQFELAKSYIRKRKTLLIPKETAMKTVGTLLDFNYNKEAKLVFELSEPIEFFTDKKILDFSRDYTLINLFQDWASNAPYFYKIDKVCSLILSLKVKESSFPQRTEKNLKAGLFYKIGQTLIKKDDFANLEIIFQHLKKLNETDCYFYLLRDSWRIKFQTNNEKAKKYFDLATKLSVKDNKLIELANGYFFINEDKNKAKEIVSKISYPKTPVKIESNNFNSLIYRFKLIRLMVALNFSFSLETLIPSPKKDYDRGLVLLERNFGELAILWGKYLSGKKMASEILQASILPLIKFYNKEFLSITDWTSSYSISQSRWDFFQLLISFIESAYPNELMNIFKIFKSQWSENDTKGYWNNNIKRKIILIFFDAGCTQLELKDELDNLEKNHLSDMYEKINDYFDQVSISIKLNQREKTERILKKLIGSSINIGWSKDYQLSTWIDWLGLYNKKEPQDTKRRIEKFIRYIQISNETTEGHGVHISCEELIRISVDFSPSYAFGLSKWLLDNSLISFSKCVDCLVSSLVRVNHISIDEGVSIIKHILLPVSENGEHKTLKNVIRKLKKVSKTESKKTVLELIEAINCHSCPSTQNELRRSIADSLDEINIDWMDFGIKWDEIKDNQLSSDSYEIEIENQALNFFEFEKKIQSVSDLINFKKSSKTFFEWNELIRKKKDLISKDDLPLLKEAFKEDSGWSEILYILSDHFYNIGEKNISLQLAEELFNDSQFYGWTRFLGGTRIKAFKALKRHKPPEEFRKNLIKTLANDSQEFSGYLDIVQEFDEIFKLISEEIPITSLWPFIDEFLERLFSTYTESDFSLSEIKGELPITFQILLPLLSHNVNLISQGAYLVISDLFSKTNNKDLIGQIIDKSNDEQQALLLNILTGIIFYDPFKKSLIPIKSLKKIQSNNFYVRVLAQSLLKELDNKYIQKYTGKTNEKNKLYELVFPEPKPSRLYGIEQYDERRILPDTSNPFENIKMYMPYINLLSKLSGIQIINLAIRTGQIMDELTGTSFYGAESERKLLSNLAAQNLQLAFRRPRALIARRAICHLISELLDTDKIKQEKALMIIHEFSYIDPLLANFDWSQKPDFIQYNLPESRIPDNWTNEPINRTQLNVGTEVGSMIIIGEIQKIKSMSWSATSEEIEQVLSFSKTFKSNQSVQLNNKCLYQDYPKNLDSLNILYLNPGIYFDTKQSNWLAIHPLFMNKYGVKLSKEKPFTWLSNDGKIIAQTIFWKNGTIEHSSPSYQDQCGEGVLCLLDKNFLNKILSKNKVYLKAKRERYYMNKKDKIRNSVTLCELYSK